MSEPSTEKRKRLVLDTNVIISAVLFRSSSARKAIERAFEEGNVLCSTATRNELRDVIGRRKFDLYVPRDLRAGAVEELIEDMEPVEIRERIAACRDARDDKFLELAANGQANAIITGDSDLLVLHPFRGIDILAPTVYLSR